MTFILGTIASSRKSAANNYFYYSASVDYQGNDQVVGMPNGNVAFAGYRSSRNFIAKLDPTTKTIAWELDNANGTEGYSRGIAVDSGNNLYYPLAQGATGGQVWLSKISNTGSVTWTRRVAGNSDVQWTGGTVLDSNDVILWGLTNGYGNANYDALTSRYDTSGNYIQSQYIRHPSANSTFWVYNGAWTSGNSFIYIKPTGTQLSGWGSTQNQIVRCSDPTGAVNSGIIYGTNSAPDRNSIQLWSDSSAIYSDLFENGSPANYTVFSTDGYTGINWQKRYTSSAGNLLMGYRGGYSDGNYSYLSGYMTPPTGSQQGIYAKINNSNGNIVWVRRIAISGNTQTTNPAGIWADATNVYLAVRLSSSVQSIGGIMVLNQANPPTTMTIGSETWNFDDITSTITTTTTSHTATTFSPTGAGISVTNSTQTLSTGQNVTFTKQDF